MSPSSNDAPDEGAPPDRPARRPEDWTAPERLRLVVEASTLGDEVLGILLRREGLHQAQLEAWRAAALEALEPAATKGPKAASEARRVRELEREVRRKDKALAEATALLVLSKKVRALWADEGDDTSGKNEL